ncbi:MAG: alpha/beta hydrolase [Bacteroidota bacterium]|nr:alpha/beta hydrolase [Bacteroidota bacterium]
MNKLQITIQAWVIIFLTSALSAQQNKEILLWSHGAPGSESKTGKEKIRIAEGGDHVISGIHHPSITPYLPAKEKNTGAAIIIAPGGGHRELWIDHEGYNPAQWFSERGIAAFVLKYRLAKEDSSTYTVDDNELADMQRAIRLVKSKAKEWGIDTARIGVMGFSAGGEVAALSAMRFDNGKAISMDTIERQSSRPAFQALIYPGNSSRYMVSKNSPPVFIVCGYNDRPDISKGMAELYLKYKDAGVPAELHIYATVGHGFGMRASNKGGVAGWPMRLAEWLTDIGIVKKN